MIYPLFDHGDFSIKTEVLTIYTQEQDYDLLHHKYDLLQSKFELLEQKYKSALSQSQTELKKNKLLLNEIDKQQDIIKEYESKDFTAIEVLLDENKKIYEELEQYKKEYEEINNEINQLKQHYLQVIEKRLVNM